MKIRVLNAVMNTTKAIVEMKPEKRRQFEAALLVHRGARVYINLQILDCHWLGRNDDSKDA